MSVRYTFGHGADVNNNTVSSGFFLSLILVHCYYIRIRINRRGYARLRGNIEEFRVILFVFFFVMEKMDINTNNKFVKVAWLLCAAAANIVFSVIFYCRFG